MVLAGVNLKGRVLAARKHIHLLHLPGMQALANLLRKAAGICSSSRCFWSENGGGLVVSVAVTRCAGGGSDQHIGTKLSYHPHHVSERNLVSAPLLKCLIRILREAEVRDAAEALLHLVIATGRHKFQRAQHAEFVKEVAAGLVLAAFAAGKREQHDFCSASPRFVDKEATVFVVRMRGGLHQPSCGVQFLQEVLQARDADVLWKTVRIARCWRLLRGRSLRSRGERHCKRER